jgi:hypothetical protein
MTISFPLNLPTTPKAKIMTMIPESAVGRAESDWTLTEQIFTNDGDRWLFDLKYPPLTVAEHKIMAAFLCSVIRGGTFYVGDPKNSTPAGIIGGSVTVSGSHAKGVRALNITGTASASNWLKAGDDIQIGSYLYKVLKDANVSGGGVCALDIFPALRVAMAGGESVIYQDAKTLCRLRDGNASWSVDPDGDGIYDVEFQVIEALP